MQEEEPPHPDDWNSDPVTMEVSEHIFHMPDRPKVVLAIINFQKEKDEEIARALMPIWETYLNFMPYKVYETVSVRVFLFAFDTDSAVPFWKVIACLSLVPSCEAGLYTDGVPVLRVARARVSEKKGPEIYPQ